MGKYILGTQNQRTATAILNNGSGEDYIIPPLLLNTRWKAFWKHSQMERQLTEKDERNRRLFLKKAYLSKNPFSLIKKFFLSFFLYQKMLLSEKPYGTHLIRGNKRLLVALLTVISFISLTFFALNKSSLNIGSCGRTIRSLNEAVAFSTENNSNTHNSQTGQAKFINLNHLEATANAKNEQEHVLILTPLKNAEAYLERYFELVDRLTYPKELISMAFLVSDTTDNTIPILKKKAEDYLNRQEPSQRYHDIAIYEKDFHFQLPEDKRHTFELQPLRRSFMARSRNYLLTAALREYHSWVLWLDVDVIEYPHTILEDLQSVNVDVVVPNCLLDTEDGSFWAYDKNNWQETDKSIEMQKDLDPVNYPTLYRKP